MCEYYLYFSIKTFLSLIINIRKYSRCSLFYNIFINYINHFLLYLSFCFYGITKFL